MTTFFSIVYYRIYFSIVYYRKKIYRLNKNLTKEVS